MEGSPERRGEPCTSDTKKLFLDVFLSKPMKDWYSQQGNANTNLAKKIVYTNKLRAAFVAWGSLVAYRRLVNDPSDTDSDVPPLVASSDSDPGETVHGETQDSSDSDSDPDVHVGRYRTRIMQVNDTSPFWLFHAYRNRRHLARFGRWP